MQHILHLASEYPPAPVFGLGRYVHELAQAQVACGIQVHVITNSIGGDQPDTTIDGVRVTRVHFPPPPKAPAASAMLLHFNLQLVERCVSLRQTESHLAYDAIVAHDWLTVPAAIHLSRILGCPLMAVIHDVVFNKVRNRPFTPEDAYIAGIENWACHSAAKIIVLSSAVRHELLEHYHANPAAIELIPSGVGIRPLAQAEVAKVTAWRGKHLPHDSDLLLYAGRLDPEKGVTTLLKALARLKQQRAKPFKLLLAGTGQLEQQVRETIRAEGLETCAELIGYQQFEELRVAYAAADVTIVPSEYEPFGLVALEAQAMGTPVVLAKTGGLAETFALTQGGLAFEPGNAQELAACLEQLLDQPQLRADLGTAGQANVNNRFSWSGVAARFSAMCAAIKDCGSAPLVTPPPWTLPARFQQRPAQQSTLPVATAPVSDVVVLWDTGQLDDLTPLLERLHSAHALLNLGGRIRVVRLICKGDGQSKPAPPFVAENVTYEEFTNPDALQRLFEAAACILTVADLASVITQTGLYEPGKYPTVLCSDRLGLEPSGLHVNAMELVYGAVTKALCDQRFRRALAPECKVAIPQASTNVTRQGPSLVLHVVPQLVTGGAETTLLDLVKGCAAGFQHAIVSLGAVEGPLPAEFEALGVSIHRLAGQPPDEITRRIQSLAPDLLHLHSMSYVPGWIPVHRRLANLRIIETEHVVNIGSGHFGPVDKVVCVSAATAKAHERYAPLFAQTGPAFEVVYNGICMADYQSLPSKEEARQALGLPLDRPVVGRVSALARNKLPQEALDAIPLLLKRIPNALIVIVGDGPERPSAERWVAEHGLADSVRFLGERRDIPRVLRAFDVFAYYTTRDALGNVILEAVAAGVPVVTTAVEGTPEALGDAPGELVPLGNVEAFAEAVARVLNKHASPTGYKLPEKFTRTVMAQSYARIYRELLDAERPIAAIETCQASGKALLIKFPTRGRPEKFFATLAKYRELLSGKHACQFLVSCDQDDATMNNAGVIESLKAIPNLSYCFGNNRNKVEAINADLNPCPPFDALLLASDDMIPQVHGYDDVILSRLAHYFPSGDGVLFFNDGFRGRTLNTLVVMDKQYYDRFGYIYQPSYECLWCDNEFTDVANLLGRQVYLDEVIIRHEHPLNIGQAMDAQNQRDDARFQHDKATYLKRRETLFGIEPRVLLSILICTLDSRKEPFERLKGKLLRQAEQAGLTRNIEVLAFGDDGKLPIGTKRNTLISKAMGEYVCFVDDDDDISDAYVSRLAMEMADGAADVIGFTGLMIGPPGTTPKPFVHSLRYTDWFEENRTYYRPPNHLNPIRREIATRYRFREVSKEEDKAFSMALVQDQALKKERFIEDPLYRYYPSIFREEQPLTPQAHHGAGQSAILVKPPKQKILFMLLFRLGDVLCGTPTFLELRKQHPHDHLAWVVMPQYAALVPSCADEVIVHGNEHDNVHTLKQPDWLKTWDKVIDVQPSWHLEEWRKTNLPLVSFIAHLAGVEVKERHIHLDITDAHRRRAAEIVKGMGEFVVMNAGPHISGPAWTRDQRNEIAAEFRRRGLKVTALAGKDGETIEGAIPLHGLPFQVAAAVVEKAQLYVGNDCGTSWLACAAHETPKIILVDRSKDRLGYDSYVDCLDDNNIIELPLGTATGDLLKHAESFGIQKAAASVRVATSIQEERTALTAQVRDLVSSLRPKRVLETGTFEGTGTTRILATALKDSGIQDAHFVSVEVNPAHAARARENLERSGLAPYVNVQQGLSVPRALLPAQDEIHRQVVENLSTLELDRDIYVDHEAAQRAAHYLAETRHDGPDDLMGKYLQEHGSQVDLALLDSAGHLGFLEFKYLIERLKGPCVLVLDDAYHVKHYPSLLFMRKDPRFSINLEHPEHFGFCVAAFTPRH